MASRSEFAHLQEMKRRYPDKFKKEEVAFRHIRRGARIFIGTGCGQPQYLVRRMVDYVRHHPKSIFDAELLQIWSLGIAPYIDKDYKNNFRLNSFFVGEKSRAAVNEGFADYTPIRLARVPDLFMRGMVPIDVALVQASMPDAHGYMSLGVSVDIVKAATEKAQLVIVQVNSYTPRVHGDGFIHIDDVDYIIHWDEPLIEAPRSKVDPEVVEKIGRNLARLVQDGDTIQVGYGTLANSVIRSLRHHKHLGIHSELLSDGLIELMRCGAVDNSRKSINRGRTVAAYSMASHATYDYIDDNFAVEFRTIDYTNNALLIARQDNMTAINSCLELDLTGQATSESLGSQFFSGIGGQADFMRGALLARNGKSILLVQSTADQGRISRIVASLSEGAGVTLNRGDIYYVISEYGVAYLHGKNIRERAMELISIAHPDFRPRLIEDAKKRNLIYPDQLYIKGLSDYYPQELETHRTTRRGIEVFLRPMKMSDEPIIKEFFYSLSDQSMQRRYMSVRRDMPHERLQAEYGSVDYTRDMMILAFRDQQEGKRTELLGIGQYALDERSNMAEVAFTVRDDFQGHGLGRELLTYLTFLARRQGLIGFNAEVLLENRPMLKLFESMGYEIEKQFEDGVYELTMRFR